MIHVNDDLKFIDLTASLAGEAVAKALVVPEAASTTAAEVAAAIDEIRPAGGEVVVVAANHSVATQVTRLAAVLTQLEEQGARLVDAMFVPRSTVTPAAAS